MGANTGLNVMPQVSTHENQTCGIGSTVTYFLDDKMANPEQSETLIASESGSTN